MTYFRKSKRQKRRSRGRKRYNQYTQLIKDMELVFALANKAQQVAINTLQGHRTIITEQTYFDEMDRFYASFGVHEAIQRIDKVYDNLMANAEALAAIQEAKAVLSQPMYLHLIVPGGMPPGLPMVA